LFCAVHGKVFSRAWLRVQQEVHQQQEVAAPLGGASYSSRRSILIHRSATSLLSLANENIKLELRRGENSGRSCSCGNQAYRRRSPLLFSADGAHPAPCLSYAAAQPLPHPMLSNNGRLLCSRPTPGINSTSYLPRLFPTSVAAAEVPVAQGGWGIGGELWTELREDQVKGHGLTLRRTSPPAEGRCR
jgi:hypothetical protein